MTDRLRRLIEAERRVQGPGSDAASKRWSAVVRRVTEGNGPSVAVSTSGLPEVGLSAGPSGVTTTLVLLASLIGGGVGVGVLAMRSGDTTPTPTQPSVPSTAPESAPAATAPPANRTDAPSEDSAVPPVAAPPVQTPPVQTPPVQTPPVQTPPAKKDATSRRAPPTTPRQRSRAHPPRGDVRAAPPPRPDNLKGDLRAEAALLSEAWTALDAGSLGAASLRLAKHKREYPNGQLGPERRAAEVVLRCRSGQLTAGTEFLDTHPDSAYASRIKTACEKKAKSP